MVYRFTRVELARESSTPTLCFLWESAHRWAYAWYAWKIHGGSTYHLSVATSQSGHRPILRLTPGVERPQLFRPAREAFLLAGRPMFRLTFGDGNRAQLQLPGRPWPEHLCS